MDTVGGEEGEGEMYGETNVEIHNATRETDGNGNSLCDSGNSNRGPATGGGWGGEGDGRQGTWVCLWLILVHV